MNTSRGPFAVLTTLLPAVPLLAPLSALHAADTRKPNILLIVADDMGFSDAACYGGERMERK